MKFIALAAALACTSIQGIDLTLNATNDLTNVNNTTDVDPAPAESKPWWDPLGVIANKSSD